jgi:biotin synthesis protein BioG
MQIKYINRRNNPRLILFFAGWSAVPECVADLTIPEGYDFCVCYDYRNMDFVLDAAPYKEIAVVAWSLGVMVADMVLPSLSAPVTRCVAVNGTLNPMDDMEGIPTAIFEATMSNVTDDGMMRFNRRMCGKSLMKWYDSLPKRPVESLSAELNALYAAAMSRDAPSSMLWSKAFISNRDMIFPPENMMRSWNSLGVATECVDAPHFPFNIWNSWTEILK